MWLKGTDAARSVRLGDLGTPLPPVVGADAGGVRASRSPHPLSPDCTGEACITCSDEGRVAEVRAVHGDGSAAVVMDGGTETIDVTLVEPVAVDDLLLVHAGVALTTLGR